MNETKQLSRELKGDTTTSVYGRREKQYETEIILDQIYGQTLTQSIHFKNNTNYKARVH